MPKTKQQTNRPGQIIRHKGKAVAAVLTMDEYEQLVGNQKLLRLDPVTRRTLEEAFPDLMAERSILCIERGE